MAQNLWLSLILPPPPPEFDVIIPVAAKDIDNLYYCVKNILDNINPHKIVIIANHKAEKFMKNIDMDSVEFCDEDTLMENLTLSTVESIMEKITGTSKRSGWYFQQFLKMAYAYKCPHKYYLIWDADTILLNKIAFWDSGRKPLFAMKTEYHILYLKRSIRIACWICWQKLKIIKC